MGYETIRFEIENNIATLILNRPHKLNSFTTQMHREVQNTLAIADTDKTARVMLTTGAGRSFCAGQDLSERAVTPGSDNVDLGHSVESFYNPLVQKIANLPVPGICAVNGVAAGAGANIALACDILLAIRSAKFVESFANIGLIPDSGGTYHLPRHLGQARALGIALTGDPVSAEQAEAWAMIWKAVDAFLNKRTPVFKNQ